MEQKYSIHRRNHIYGGNKNLGRGTNQDYTRNKKLVCGTKLWLENMEEKKASAGQITTTEGTNIYVMEQIKTLWGTKNLSA
jgi:hypothetical protein